MPENQAREYSLSEQLGEQHTANVALGDFGRHWSVYGEEGINGYQRSFKGVLCGQSLISFVKGRTSPVVLDLMAPSGILSDLFIEASTRSFPFLGSKKCKPTLGIAVCLEEYRWKYKERADKELNIAQLKGDLTSAITWERIEEKLQGKKADLILERAVGGLSLIPCDRRLYAVLASKLWHLLCQVPILVDS